MAYFKSELGQRPLVPPEAPAPPEVSRDAEKEPRLFAAGLGACPRPPPSGYAARQEPLPAADGEPQPVACPLCQARLSAPDPRGVCQCAGRCGARWLPDSAGRLLDLAALSFGICACCQPAQALVRAEGGAVCPRSAQEYLLLPGGPIPRAQAAPEGLCACCAPAAALVRQGGDLVCSARPAQRYELQGDMAVPVAQSAGAAATLAAIDAALRKNSARVGVNGLFDLES